MTMHPALARLRLQAEVDAARGRLARPVDTKSAIAGDGNGNVAIPNSHDILYRSATGRVLFATNPDLHVIEEGEALQLIPMSDREPMLWRVPSVRPNDDVYWVSGAVLGQTPGLFTPAHQFEHGGAVDVAPHPTLAYDFILRAGDFIYHVTADGGIALVAGGGALFPIDGEIIAALDAQLTSVRTLSVTPSGNGVLVGLTAAPFEVEYATDAYPDPEWPGNNIIRHYWRYEYDEIRLYSYEPATATIRNIRVRLEVNYEYIVYSGLSLNGRSDGGVIPSPYAEIVLTGGHFNFARWNPVYGALYLGIDLGRIITVAWSGAATPPATDPFVGGDQYPFTAGPMVDMAFTATGAVYVATMSGGGAGQVWNWSPGGSAALVAGDGVLGGVFPVDGSAATSGDLGSIGGIAFDDLGRLLIACGSANRLAAVSLATGTITTLTGFGRATVRTENLVEPLATAVFTGMNSLQTDSAGRQYIGATQVKRIGA